MAMSSTAQTPIGCPYCKQSEYEYTIAAQEAEIKALRAEMERLRADRDSWEQQASDRVADWHAEHLRAERLAEALRRAHRWGGLGKGWDSGVALDLIAWIESGMHGELPPLPDYLAAALAQEDCNG